METALAVNDKIPAATAVALGATKVTSKKQRRVSFTLESALTSFDRV